MATGLAAGQANGILDALCRNVAYTAPAGFFVKLHTGDPGAAGTANAAGETTRKATTFSAAAAGAITTSADVAWTNVSTSETLSHVSFWSAVSGGTFLGSDDLNVAKAVVAGDNFSIVAGSLSLSIAAIAA